MHGTKTHIFCIRAWNWKPSTTLSTIRYDKVHASHTGYRALGPELIPCTGSQPSGDYKSSTGLRLPSQPQSITAPWSVPNYTAWWQWHIGVNNLSKFVTQVLYRVGFEPTTTGSQAVATVDRCDTHDTIRYDIFTMMMSSWCNKCVMVWKLEKLPIIPNISTFEGEKPLAL